MKTRQYTWPWHGLPLAILMMLAWAIPSQASTTITADISTNTTWSIGGSPYFLTTDITVDSGVTLTIGPGVEVLLSGLFVDLDVLGTLVANGTAGNEIRIGNIGGGAGSLAFRPLSTGSLDYVIFDSIATSTSSAFDAALYLEAEIAMNHCTFTDINTDDVKARADVVSLIGPNNVFGSETIRLFLNSLEDNATWPLASASGITYHLEGDQTVSIGNTLTVEPGVSVFFASLFTDLFVQGTITAVGTGPSPISFLGDGLNGGGSVALLDGSTGTFQHARFGRLGNSVSTLYDCALYVDSADLIVANSVFEENDVDIKGRADAMSNVSSNNQLDLVQLLLQSIEKSASLPNMTSTGTTYKLLGDLTVPAGVSYGIAPGVSLNLDNVFTDFFVLGNLQATGNASEPIRFYSTANNGGGSLALLDGSTAILSNLILDSLGVTSASAYDCALYVADADLTISASTFIDNLVDIIGRGDRLRAFDGSTGIEDNNSLSLVRLINNSIQESTTWPTFTPDGITMEIVSDATIPANALLTVSAPIDLHLVGLFTDLFVQGGLTAEGTAIDSIRVFGIGSNGGGSISFESDTATGSFAFVRFDSMGVSSSSLRDCALYTRGASIGLTDCSFTNNGVDIKGHGEGFRGFSASNNVDLIYVEIIDIDQDATWVQADTLGVTYSLRGDVKVNENVVLSIQPGVRVEFPDRFTDLRIEGSLQAIGSVYDSILFVGLSANGGGSLALLSTAQNCDLAYCGFDQLGISGSSTYDAGLWVETPNSVDVFACRFSSLNNGIIASGSAAPNVEGCAFRDNTIGLDVRSGASASVSYNAFTGHSNLAVANNLSNPPLDACNNYWGPGNAFNAVNYPTGTGDPVSENVIANPGCILPVDPHVVCIPPQATDDQVLSPTSVRLVWQRVPGAFGYRVDARKDTLSGIFRSSIARRVIDKAIGAGDTIIWQVKTGCPFDTSNFSANDTIIIPALRIAAEQAELMLWPNPAQGVVFLRLPSAEGPMTLTLYDASGRVVKAPEVFPAGEGRTEAVALQGLAAGWYAYSLETPGTAPYGGELLVE